MTVRRIELLVDEDDYRAIQEAIGRRQAIRVMPEGDGNVAGRVVAEVCRGWIERLDMGRGDDDEAGEEWKQA